MLTGQLQLDDCLDCLDGLITTLWDLMDDGSALFHQRRATYYNDDKLIQSYQDELRNIRSHRKRLRGRDAMNNTGNNTGIKTGLSDLWNTDIGDWSISIDNPMILVAFALLLVSLFLTLRASWRRLYPVKPSRAIIVALLNIVAFATVLTILIQPQRMQLVKQQVLLITEGTDMAASSLLNSSNVYVSPNVLVTPESLQHLKNASWLLNIAQLPLREPALTNIDVRGFGLSRSQWHTLPGDVSVDFTAPAINGFTNMRWPRTLVAGETLHIGGHYTNQAVDSVITLRLLNPAGAAVDETRVRNEDYFSLSARPRTGGSLVYILQAWAGESLLHEQVVPLSVGTTAAINIMVEQSAPSFETRQLKNYAAGNGARVLINSQISRGKSISQAANLSDDAEITFSPPMLAAQHVLIMDGRALTLLADQQLKWLADAVAEGLGILIFADTSLLEASGKLKAGLLAGLELTSVQDAQAELVPRLISNPASGWQQPLPIAGIQLRAPAADLLIDDGHGQALVLNKSSGLGHVAVSRIKQSHRWLTAGNRDHWSDYWAALISAVGRPRSDSYLLPQPDDIFPRIDERTAVCALSNDENLVATLIAAGAEGTQAEFDILLSPDKLGSPRQCGWFWPQQLGWHQVLLRSKSSKLVLDQQGIFIFDQYQWLAQIRDEHSIATQTRSARNTGQQVESGEEKWVSEPVDVFWLYLLLVTSASLLWLERKQFYFQ